MNKKVNRRDLIRLGLASSLGVFNFKSFAKTSINTANVSSEKK